jgi:hypothetical protein
MIRARTLGRCVALSTLGLGLGLILAAGGCVRVDLPTDPGYVASGRDDDPADARPDRMTRPRPDADPRSGDGVVDVVPVASPDAGASTGPDGFSDVGGGPRDAGSADAGDSLGQGLVALWSFDEGTGLVAADGSGHGNQATLHNGVAWRPSTVPGAGGRPGNFAVALDGTDDYLDVPAAHLPGLGAPKSIAFWLALDPDAPPVVDSNQRTCLALLDAGPGAGLQIGLDRQRPAAWSWGQNQGFVVAPAEPTPGFHHWAYTFDGTIHRLYVDGRAVGSKSARPAPGAIATLLIGTYAVPNEMCAGQLDDLRIYDRALGAAEVAQLAAAP